MRGGTIGNLRQEVGDRWDEIRWYANQLQVAKAGLTRTSSELSELKLQKNRNQRFERQVKQLQGEIDQEGRRIQSLNKELTEVDTLLEIQQEDFCPIQQQLDDTINQRDQALWPLEQAQEEAQAQRFGSESVASDALSPPLLDLIVKLWLPNIELVRGSVECTFWTGQTWAVVL